MTTHRILYRRDLATIYGRSMPTIDRWVRDGVIPTPNIHMGRIPGWTEDIIAADIESKRSDKEDGRAAA